ncbi:hypothetical protein CYMTET_55838 [Cymbomonas tetramitiformis]|uniref:Uncharacterized protein n=1 Tax=Cymbomonas tetramitiformis TaxID=36881 RepID=A0AAE0EMZ3_9CHLO|nr:hypothetical protein CYMTET_55838 [Cymbomonas tetramitiformis]
MSSGNDRLILWTSSVAKAKLRTLLQFSKVTARMWSTSWDKQRGQILDWAKASLANLQLLLQEVLEHTEVLLGAVLFSLDSSRALSVGLWLAMSGAWASRKGAEFEKFNQVATWAQALLQLVAPVPTTGTVVLVAGGLVVSGASGAGTGAVASSGPVGTAGVASTPGIGTVAAVGSAPAVSAASVGAGGPGGGVLAGTVGATMGPGTGTAAVAATNPAAAVSPDVIAAAIASALGHKLDALGSRLATLEARGSAPAGAVLLSGGPVPPEAELLTQALRDSIATIEGWDMAKCAQACADLVHEAAKLRSQLTLLNGIHPFGKLPMKAVEALAFPAMVYALPELAEEECERDELLVGKEATFEHWRAFVHLLQARVGEFQCFVKSKEEEARAAGGGRGLLPPLDAAHREQLAALGSSFRTVNEEQLARALRAVPPGEPESSQEAPAGAEKDPVATPGPAVEMDTAPVVEMEIEVEDVLVETESVELKSMEADAETSQTLPAEVVASERWWADLRADEFIPVWDVLGGPRRHDQVPLSIPTLTSRAHLVAAAFQDWHDVDFLVRCAACGAGWPSEEIEVDEPYRVPNYVGPEHMRVMRDEIERESEEGRIFLAIWRLPLGIIALGMVEKATKAPSSLQLGPLPDTAQLPMKGLN